MRVNERKSVCTTQKRSWNVDISKSLCKFGRKEEREEDEDEERERKIEEERKNRERIREEKQTGENKKRGGLRLFTFWFMEEQRKKKEKVKRQEEEEINKGEWNDLFGCEGYKYILCIYVYKGNSQPSC